MRKGIETTEFWLTAITNVVLMVITVAGARGFITAEEGELYQFIGGTLASTVAPIVAALVTRAYIGSRAEAKKAANGK